MIRDDIINGVTHDIAEVKRADFNPLVVVAFLSSVQNMMNYIPYDIPALNLLLLRAKQVHKICIQRYGGKC